MNKTLNKKYKYFILFFIIFSVTLLTFCKGRKGKKETVTKVPEPGINGIVVMKLGNVEIQHANGIFKQIKIKDIVKQKDIIQSGKNSFATIQFQDRALIRIQSNTKIKLNRLFSNNNSDLYLEKGQVLSKINKLKKNENFGIRTHTAVASVRGTEFSASFINNKSIIAVLKGKVAVKPPVKEDAPAEKVFEKSENEKIIESGKEVVAEVSKTADSAKQANNEQKFELKVKPISKKEELTIQKISIVSLVAEPEKKSEKELKVIQKSIEKEIKKIDKKIKVEIIKEKREIKKKKIIALIKKKPKNLKEIKEVFERIDEITLFNGRVLKGAIMSRGNTYRVLTLGGVKNIPGKQIKGVKVIK